jgi:DNA-binding protein
LSSKKSVNSYIIRAASLLLDAEKPLEYIVFKATGNAIPTAFLAAEITRRRIEGLH